VRTVLHLVRPGATPQQVAERDWVVYLQTMELASTPGVGVNPSPSISGAGHASPIPAGTLTHDQLVALTFAADIVVTW